MNELHGSTPSEPAPTERALQAALELLGEARAHVVHAAHEQLVRWGEPARPALERAAEQGDVPTRLRARAVLRALDVRSRLQRFAALSLDRGDPRDPNALLDGAVLLSHMVRTFSPETAELKQWLRVEAEQLKAKFLGRSLAKCARILADHLTVDLGFRAADPASTDLDHALLDRALHHRTGTPIALSLVYLLLARFSGLSVAGVALPDHFLVRLHGVRPHGVRPVLLDPYRGGRTVTKADCWRYLRAAGHHQVRAHLVDLTDRALLGHYLRSLRRAATHPAGAEARRSLGHALEHLEAK